MDLADPEVVRAFYIESEEILERIDADLSRMESSFGSDESVNSVFRGLHTIKGNSSFLSLGNITELAHAAETLLDKARKKEVAVSNLMVDVLHAVFDDLKRMIVDQDTQFDGAHTIASIHGFLNDSPAKAMNGASLERSSAKINTNSFVRVDDVKIAKIISLVSELELLRYSLEMVPERIDQLGHAAADIRFDLDIQITKLSRLTRSLSSLVFGVRLVPVKQVFQRFPRIVEGLASKLGKEIALEITNGDAELDKLIVEAIADPLTHLIRNSADHGIENPAERVRAGKPRMGTIKLNSFVRGNYVFIEITDDGRGIDGDKILKKAIENGIVPEENSHALSESGKLALIFAPGLSTAEKITDLSGRGVGMDVVKSNINRLKGTVIVDSKVGRGTLIQLRFPMSVAVLFSLFVEVNQTYCAIPVEQVNESVDYFPSELLPQPPEGADPEKYIALYSLRSLLWRDEEEEEEGGRLAYHALRFKEDRGRKMAFVVDSYSSIEEAIVQAVDSYIAALPGIQGATIRKDGSVGLVLNTESIVEHALRAKPFAYVKVREPEAD